MTPQMTFYLWSIKIRKSFAYQYFITRNIRMSHHQATEQGIQKPFGSEFPTFDIIVYTARGYLWISGHERVSRTWDEILICFIIEKFILATT